MLVTKAMHANVPNEIAAITPLDEIDSGVELVEIGVGDMSVSTGSFAVTLYPAFL